MIGYTGTNVALPVDIELFNYATVLANSLPERVDTPNAAHLSIRCHEVVRALQGPLAAVADRLEAQGRSPRRLFIADGTYHHYDHSWLALSAVGDDVRAHAILDVYAVGRLPLVQLVYLSNDLRAYHETEDFRDDIREDVVQALGKVAYRMIEPKASGKVVVA